MPNGSSDTICNTSNNETFQEVVDARLSRRDFLGGGLATAATVSSGGVGALLNAVPVVRQARTPARPTSRFQGIPVSSADTVVVPPGYTAKVLIAWGDPVSRGPAFKPDASNSAAEQARQWGMHNDGLVYFPINGSSHGLLVQNNEYTDDVLLFPDGIANWNQEKTNKSLNAHGVSIIEIAGSAAAPQGSLGLGFLVRVSGTTRRRRVTTSDKGEWHVVRPSTIRPPDHRHDADQDGRTTGTARRADGRSAPDHQRRSDRPPGARHDQQLRDGLHAVGHLSRVRGELQRLLPEERGARRRSNAATASPPRAPATSGTRPTSGSASTRSRTSRTASDGSSSSIPSTRARRR